MNPRTPTDHTPADGRSGRGSRRRSGRGERTSKGRRQGGPRPFDQAQQARRRASVPPLKYPPELPVSQRADDIAAAISANQVTVISGETGSGKTTQIPKICLALGRGIAGMIGHTQPRRIAARSVAERISDELGTPLGETVGYQVRFTDQVGDNTLVKLMTDGILLAEIQHDPQLLAYDTIIVDEAHERSLNIDFILGYLARLLPQRPDLKLIITSATIDAERFAEHFASACNLPEVPIIEVSGRTYPVELRYRPYGSDMPEDLAAASLSYDAPDQASAICEAVGELLDEGPGDILVFLSGEGEIRDAHSALLDEFAGKAYEAGAAPGSGYHRHAFEIFELYARMPSAEQHRIFAAHQMRRVILSTNIAETSVTVPGIRYVIDPGTARISRYSPRTKVQRLPIEKISQASANQRSGRCGRVAEGIAIRLYSEEDFANRAEFTEPEIIRTSLASVILQMASLGLGPVEDFPFVDPPDMRAVRAGVQLLTEIGALGVVQNNHKDTHDGARGKDAGYRLTGIGRQLARLPIDPRLGRMLIEAENNGCAGEVLVIVAALSVQDVRERPAEKRPQADQFHRRFTVSSSDFLAYLNLWRYLQTCQRDLSGSAFRRLMRREFLNYLRFREWQDVVFQLRQMARQLRLATRRLDLPTPGQLAKQRDADGHIDVARAVVGLGKSDLTPAADDIHRSLLVGLLSNIGYYDERKGEYRGARGTRWQIWPGSGLAKMRHPWVMTAELVETSRLFARTVARINPEWIEPLAADLLTRSYSDPYWSARKGCAMTREKVMLYGLTIVADRPALARRAESISHEVCREMFIRHGLVEGDWRQRFRFFTRNAALIEQAREVEQRSRQRGLVIDAAGLARFYDERVPDEIISLEDFARWYRSVTSAEGARDPLIVTDDELYSRTRPLNEGAFPDIWHQGELQLPLIYRFDPTSPADGLTCRIPLHVLPQVSPHGFDYLVPGLLDELILGTIRALPKSVRRELVPAPEVASQIAPLLPPWEAAVAMAPGEPVAPSFRDAFSAAVKQLRGIEITEQQWDTTELPAHLRMRFEVIGRGGKVLAEGTSLPALQREMAPRARSAVSKAVRQAVAQAARESGSSPSAAANMSDAQVRNFFPPDDAAASASPSAPRWSLREGPIDSFPAERLPWRITAEGGPATAAIRGYPTMIALASPYLPAEVASLAADSPLAVDVRVVTDPAVMLITYPEAMARLAVKTTVLASQRISTRWNTAQSLALAASPYRDTEALTTDMQICAGRAIALKWGQAMAAQAGPESAAYRALLDQLRTEAPELAEPFSALDPAYQQLVAVRDAERFATLAKAMRASLENATYQVAQVSAKILNAAREAEKAIAVAGKNPLTSAAAGDEQRYFTRLISDGFLRREPLTTLVHYPRYLQAIVVRLSKAAENPERDDDLSFTLDNCEKLLRTTASHLRSGPVSPAAERGLDNARMLFSELHVSLFAEQLGTAHKISPQRFSKALAALTKPAAR